MADVLAVVAHPDDESLFAGSFLAWLAQRGAVKVIALSDGVSSRNRSGDAIERRAAHFQSACTVLGVEGVLHPMFVDQQSDLMSHSALNRAVTELIEAEGPARLVLTHHVGDLNHDHRRVVEAVLVATRGGPSVLSMAPEYPSRCVGPAWHPTRDHWIRDDVKWQACKCYVDELRDYPHPRSERAIREQTVEQFMEIR